jgi:hypothetical protein
VQAVLGVDWLGRSQAPAAHPLGPAAAALATRFQALAHSRLGQACQARAAFEAARQAHEEGARQLKAAQGKSGWHEVLLSAVVRGEAEALVRPRAPRRLPPRRAEHRGRHPRRAGRARAFGRSEKAPACCRDLPAPGQEEWEGASRPPGPATTRGTKTTNCFACFPLERSAVVSSGRGASGKAARHHAVSVSRRPLCDPCPGQAAWPGGRAALHLKESESCPASTSKTCL